MIRARSNVSQKKPELPNCFSPRFVFTLVIAVKSILQDVPNRLPELGEYFSGTMLSPDPPASNNRQMQGPGTPTVRQNAGAGTIGQKSYGIMQSKFSNEQIQNEQQNKIYNHIKSTETEEGVHVKNIKLAINGDANFQSDLDYLTANGLLYNTLDDDHYAVVP